jgi:hypothetical protein
MKNEYRVLFVDESVRTVVAADMALVCKTYETPATPIGQITRVRPNVESVSADPALPVHFTVAVTPSPAALAGCSGTPNDFTVNDGEEVIFQAIPAAGFNFVGWYLGGVKLSSELTVKLPVEAPAIAGQTVQFVATFAAI